jgi:hypothetical protein
MERAPELVSATPLRPLPKGKLALDLAQAGIRGLARIGEPWGLTVDQQRLLLGGLPKTTYYAILKGGVRSVAPDTLERLSLLIGIWGNLEVRRLRIPDPDKVPLSRMDWAHAGRLGPARYRAAECFERIADHAGMRDLQAFGSEV